MNSPTRERPGTVYGGLVPTLNQRGFMSEKPDYYSGRFADYAGTRRDQVLDIGCAYGVATRAALERGAWVTACDMEKGHLDILEEETPVELRQRLRTVVGCLPDMDFPNESFGAILCARVLHFLLAAQIRSALAKMYGWLKPGGAIFLVADTPYTGFWQSTAADYEQRKAAGNEWPGLIEDIAPLLGQGKVPDGMLPYINPMDPDVLSRECERAGFVVEEARFTGRDGNMEGRHHAGVIATKRA
jgi:SAM-dependent methyltransferase